MSSDTQTDDAPTDEAAEEKPKLSLEVKVDEPSACERHVTVTVSRDDIDRYYQEKFDEMMPDAEVPGFRKGRAPRKLVESKFKHAVSDQVKGSLLMDSVGQASEECDFSAISEPDFDFDSIVLPDEGPMTYEFNLEVRPEFEMPQWKGMKIEKPTKKFTKRDIDQHLKNLLTKYGDLVPSDGAIEAGDYATVNITFRHDGKVVSKVEDSELRVLSKLSFQDGTIKSFEKLMVGASAGDKKEAKVKLTADAPNEELRGKSIDVEFEILDVKKLELPKIDGELLSKIGNFESEEQLRELVQQELERQLAYHQNQSVREQITGSLTESANWELPPDLLQRQSKREMDRMVMEMQRSGFSNEQIQAYSNDLKQNSQSSTETALKEHFILERIAEEEDIEDSPADYDMEIQLIAAQQGDSARRVRAQLERRGLMDTLRNQIIERKVVQLIESEADFKETKFKLPGDDTEAVDHAVGGAPDESEIPDAKAGGVAESLPAKVDRS